MDTVFLAKDLASGSQAAFRTIFDLFHHRLLFVANGIVGETGEAEDIVQDVFLKLWDKRNNFEDLQAIKAFLYICVKNACRNAYHHQKVVEKHAAGLNAEVDDRNIMLSIMEAEVIGELYAAISKLPAGCRDVIHLGYFEGLSNKEVASQLGVSINTVKTQKLRALRYLRLNMKDFSIGLVLLLNKIF